MTISVQAHMLKVNYFLQIGKRMRLFSADRALMEKTRVPRGEHSNTVQFWFDICGGWAKHVASAHARAGTIETMLVRRQFAFLRLGSVFRQTIHK